MGDVLFDCTATILGSLEEIKPRIIENIKYADIIRGSDEDFRLIFGMEDPEEVAEQIDTSSRILLYTMNTGGVQIIHKTIRLRVPAENISPVSTIGAGDNFNAGLVHVLLEKGITRKDLAGITEGDLKLMANTGVQFATHVCLHYDNYISREFADGIRAV